MAQYDWLQDMVIGVRTEKAGLKNEPVPAVQPIGATKWHTKGRGIKRVPILSWGAEICSAFSLPP